MRLGHRAMEAPGMGAAGARAPLVQAAASPTSGSRMDRGHARAPDFSRMLGRLPPSTREQSTNDG
jgi:hypothetical protein